MPMGSVKFKPGILVEPTPTLNEAGLSQSNLIRFREGMVEKLGGWAKYVNSAMNSAVRALNSWQDLYGNDRLGVGCVGDLGYVQNSTPNIPTNAAFTSICPLIDDQYVTLNVTAGGFTTSVSTQGTVSVPSNVVTIIDINRNMSVYDAVYIKTPISVGGIVLSGVYQIQTVTGSSTYTINAADYSTQTVTGAILGTDIFLPEFTTVNGQPIVTVDFPDHGLVPGQTVTFLTETIIGGISIFGDYTVISVASSSQYTFRANAIATSADTQYMGYPTYTGQMHLYYYVAYGPSASGGGYGSGPFGVGAYGIGAASANFLGTGDVNGTTLTISTVTFGAVAIGTSIYGPGIATGTIITGLGTGTGGVGTYTVTPATTPASGTVTIYGTTLHTGTTIVQSNWSLDNWGRDLIATPSGGPVYIWDPQSGYQTAAVIVQAPQANTGSFIAMPQRQIICYGSTFTGIQDPLLIRWCDALDYTVWNATSQNQAGSFRIPTGSKIITAIQAAQQALIWTDVDLWSMQYIQPPLVYGFTKISTNCGLIAQKAVNTLGPNTFWMSQRQFFIMNPMGLEVLPCSVWDFVFQNLKQGLVTDPNLPDFGKPYTDRIVCATNSQYNEVVWYFPSNESVDGENDSYVKYNVVEKVWDFGKMQRTAWIDQSILGSPIGGGVGTNGSYYIYQHEYDSSGAPLYDDDGGAMLSSFTTGYAAITNGTDFAFVDYMIPDMKWGTYRTQYTPAGVGSTFDTIYNLSNNPATVSITAYVTNYSGEPPATYSYTMSQGQDSIPSVRFRGRQVAFSFSSSDIGTWWRVGNVRYRFSPDGRR